MLFVGISINTFLIVSSEYPNQPAEVMYAG